jgi:hypothetical protein
MGKITADQHPRGGVSRIPPEQKNGFLRCSAFLLNSAGVKNRQVALREIPIPAEIRTLPEQLSPEHPSSKELHRRSLILSRCPPEPPLAEMALWRGASISTMLEQLLCGKSSY